MLQCVGGGWGGGSSWGPNDKSDKKQPSCWMRNQLAVSPTQTMNLKPNQMLREFKTAPPRAELRELVRVR